MAQTFKIGQAQKMKDGDERVYPPPSQKPIFGHKGVEVKHPKSAKN